MNQFRRSLLLIAPIALGLSLGLVSQTPRVVTVGVVPNISLKVGDPGSIKIPLHIAAGYHIQSDHPTLDYIIASTLTFKTPDGLTLAQINWPRPQSVKFQFSDQALPVFQGDISVSTIFLATAKAVGGHHLEGSLRYQACTDTACQAPKTVPLSADVVVAAH